MVKISSSIRPPSRQATTSNKNSNHEAIAKAADELSDKPYGTMGVTTPSTHEEQDPLERITISLPRSLRYRLDDLALKRKRGGHQDKNASAIVRIALEKYLNEIE